MSTNLEIPLKYSRYLSLFGGSDNDDADKSGLKGDSKVDLRANLFLHNLDTNGVVNEKSDDFTTNNYNGKSGAKQWAQFIYDAFKRVAGKSTSETLKTLAESSDNSKMPNLARKLSTGNHNAYKSYNDLVKEFVTDTWKVLDVSVKDELKHVTGSSTVTVFDYVKHDILKEFLKEEEEDVPLSSMFNTVSESYHRDAEGHLVVVRDGKEMLVKEEATSLGKPEKCWGTGMKDVNCNEYITDCLVGKNITECKKFMTNPDFWRNAQEAVKNMNAKVAYDTLRAFEFRTVTSTENVDGVNMVLNLVEETGSWLQRLMESDSKTALSVRKNDRLMGYLKMLVEKINTNPAIMNPHFTKFNTYDPLSKSPLGVLGISRSTKNQRSAVADILMLRNTFGYSSSLSGGALFTTRFADVRDIANETVTLSSSLFEKKYSAYKDALSQKGSKVSDADDNEIKRLNNQIKENERKLSAATNYLKKYIDLMGVYSTYSKEVNMDNLKKFVDAKTKYTGRVNKNRSAMFSILEAIASALDDTTGLGSKSTSLKL
jgi:hypothetical protein